MSRKSDSGSDTDSVYDMPSGKWVVTDKVRGTSEGVQKSQTKSKKSVHPTVNFDKGVPHNTQENQYYSGRHPSEYYDDREYTFPKERSRLSPEEHDIERGKVFKQEWSKYTPFRYETDVLDDPCYYRGQQRVRSPPRLGYVRGGPHYSGGQYEVKSPYDQGYARSPREYYKPSYSDRVQETYASPPRTGYVRTPEYNKSGYVRTPEHNRSSGVPNDQSFSSGRQFKKCPSYDGKSSFKDFLIQFEMVSEFNNWNIEIMAQEFALSLKDQAVAVLADLDFSHRRHYPSLVEALKARFEPENQIQLHRAKLKSRIRRENEPLPQLAQDIRRLVRDANPGVPLEIRENMAKDSFLDALNDRDLELSVFQSQPKSLQDALRIALEIEAFHRSREKRVPLRSVKQENESSLVQNDELVQSLQLRISKLEEELKSVHVSKSETNSVPQVRDKTQKTNKSKVVCFYCDKPGHIAKNCRKKYFDKKQKQDETLNIQKLE